MTVFHVIALGLLFSCVALFAGWELGNRAALRHNKTKLEDGERYSEAVRTALRDCQAGQRVEITIQARLRSQGERRGTASLGVHTAPEPAEPTTPPR